jgi:uncharacterized protein (DUF58 family)
MLTTRSIKYIAVFIILLIFGLLLGNRILLVMSLIPFGLLVLGLLINSPQGIVLGSKYIPGRVWVGSVIDVQYTVKVTGGMGYFTLHQDLPPHFSLESGNNLRTFWKGLRTLEITFAYKIRCTKRGIYTLLPIKYSSNHVIWLKPAVEASLGENHPLIVHPKIMNVKSIRGLPGQAISPYPSIDIAKMGVTTTDFREIRDYLPGDPIKNINWKATARVCSPDPWPLTNEYEVEGKKAVWIFLDGSRILEVGTEIENAFEFSLEAANAVMYYYLNHGYRVGMYVFNNQGQLFYPDTGKKQFLKVSRHLLDLNAGNKYNEFPMAVEKCRPYILGLNPLCVIITRLDNRFSGNIVNGVKKIRQFSGGHRRHLPILVLNIPGYSMVAGQGSIDENATLMMRLNTRPRIQQIRALGAAVMNWDPLKENLNAALVKTLKKK